MNLTFSRRLALVFGVLLPIVETYRRWHQLGDIRIWPAWLDDWAIGGFLLYGAWRTAKDCGNGSSVAHGGMGVQPDPSSLPAAWVVGIKGVGFLLAILALAGSLRHPQPK